jgi:hypothetical protein
LTLIPKDNSFDIKICKTNTSVKPYDRSNVLIPQNVEILDYSDELYFTLFDNTYSTALLYMLDPYYRMKFKNTEVYNMLYYNVSSGYSNTPANETIRNTTRNLIVLDVDALLYIYHLTVDGRSFEEGKKNFDLFLKDLLPYKTNGRNARVRLNISKNKEKVLKRFPVPWILKYDNRVFDDDVDFLLDVMKLIGNDRIVLQEFLDIKSTNLHLTFQDITKKVIVSNLENEQNINFRQAIGNLSILATSYNAFKKNGFDKPFRMTHIMTMTELDFPDTPQPDANFSIDNGKVYSIKNIGSLRYANALSNAMPLDYINQALTMGSTFALAVKHGKYYLCESKDGTVINIKRNAQNALINILYL